MSAVGKTVLDDGVLVSVGRAGLVGAVADTVAESDIGAEAGGIGLTVLRRAAEVRSLTEHVVDAGLLEDKISNDGLMRMRAKTYAAGRKIGEALREDGANKGSGNDGILHGDRMKDCLGCWRRVKIEEMLEVLGLRVRDVRLAL